MLEFLPEDIRAGLAQAQRRAQRRQSRLHIQLGDMVFPILRFWESGLSLDGALAPGKIRGLVEVYDGPRHIFQCLIYTSEHEGDELICAFKRMSVIAEAPAADYWRGENQPQGYLPKA